MAQTTAGDQALVGTGLELILTGRVVDLGGFTVARLLPSAKRRLVGPFIFVDHVGPTVLGPGVGFNVRPHPHIGLSTVTYYLEGESVHRDSLGTVAVVRPGDLNLMTSGRGVVHSERADPAWVEHGGGMHGIQMWLALPEANEDDEPSFQHHAQDTLPVVTPSVGVRGTVLIGEAFGVRSPVVHPGSPFLAIFALDAGATLDAPDVGERGVAVLEGAAEVGGTAFGVHQLAVLEEGARVQIRANVAARVLLIGGPYLGERIIDWNFVASTKERIDAAREAWKAGEFPIVPTDTEEFIPYPG